MRSLKSSREERDALRHEDYLGALSSPRCSGVLCRLMENMPLRYRSVLVDAVRYESPTATPLDCDMTNIDEAYMVSLSAESA